MEKYSYFDLAVICGRFGHEHLGHKQLFDFALDMSKRLYIMVGSAQERETLRNPYSVETRIDVIKETYPGMSSERLIIGGLNDMTNELDISTDWGSYVKEHVISKTGKFANLMVYGNDEFRSRWFAAEDLIDTSEFVLPRSRVPISGTQIRGMLLIDDRQAWQKWTPQMIHSMYPRLREELMCVPVYREIYDKVRRSKIMDLDAFMKVYKEYEEEDKKRKLAAIAN